MIVYKYLHQCLIPHVLRDGLIRFTQPAALNDPFEGRSSLGEIERYFAQVSQDMSRVFGVDDDPSSADQLIANSFGRWQDDNVSNLAFLSLSKKRNSLLMWSHYSDSHRGFVLGFDSTDPFFSVGIPGTMSALREVTYAARPSMPAPNENPVEFFRACTNIRTKSNDWAYEEELRMFADPRNALYTRPGPGGHEIYLFKFPPESVAEVILGHRMVKKDREAIVKIVRETYGKAKLYETALNESEYDLDIVPYPGSIGRAIQMKDILSGEE